jgi:hypothetical protein
LPGDASGARRDEKVPRWADHRGNALVPALDHFALAQCTTAFDKRDVNHNFAYDYRAYAEVERNLGRLIASGQLALAMQLALDLMRQGSHQVEMSDEGLMTEDIESGLSVVIKAVSVSDLPSGEALAWCSAMLDADRVAFIARKPLEALRGRLQAADA